MNLNKLINIRVIFLVLAWMTFPFPVISAEVDISRFEQQCKNITAQQRQLAAAAGYDIEAACSSIKNISSDDSKDEIGNLNNVLPRNSQYITNSRGVIGEEDIIPEDPSLRTQGEDSRNVYLTEGDNEQEKLKKYGYDLFAGVPTTFAPATDIPIPADYMVGPGDTLQIQMLGKINDYHELSVSRDGQINFPELGPISLVGLDFLEARKVIKQKVSEQMIGVNVAISLGELRSIRVFVLGEAFKPGSYTVSSLSTMTNALFVSGGVTDIGSLRNIQLKRQGRVITNLDLYDLLQQGDTSKDARLMPGDVIFIPPVEMTVGIDGEINRPAIYEIKSEKSLRNLIDLAGGFTANAHPNTSHITRKNKSGFTTVVDIDLSVKDAKNIALSNGDLIQVSTVLEELEDVIQLSGAFHRPRAVKWKKGLKLSQIIHSVKDFNQDVDLNIGLVVRKEMPLREISVLSFDLKAILRGGLGTDIALEPLDEVMVFIKEDLIVEEELSETEDVTQTEITLEKDPRQLMFEYINNLESLNFLDRLSNDELEKKGVRGLMLEKVITKLVRQTSDGGLAQIVEISGNVISPAKYPLTKSMTVRDLVLLAGGLREASYLGNVEVTRRDLSNSEKATVEHFNVNLGEQLNNSASFNLFARDKLSIYVTPEYRENLNITLEGEVRFPGTYVFKRGETLSQVIKRAGGFTNMAHVSASVFTRVDLKEQEAKQLQELQNRLREDLAASQLQDAAAGESSSMQDSKGLLDALSETEALGRLVIQLDGIISGKGSDIRLKDGDSLIIPTFRQEISVLGEVQHATSHLFNEHWTLDDYLEKSGGFTNRADDDRIYVVKADGSVFLPNQSGWLTHQNEFLSPGDTVVVPLDTDRIKSLTLWTNVSQIIYQLSLGAAAVARL